ncbi:methyltransferase domain-containing protein [Actinoallomurus bryophytorum]|uniref:Methyltransferase family protein n=1 Tax=Actinoallomurus bryophytorum TaxID=1490222 RepID=A0A543CU38_9ACTN|nr:class I SAM-dependent methyltransferase [Actinoallomurus bryophytorum]TQM00624.1 methyltransferase family protein [Actinoallomurus bryophytorum]
MSCEPGTPVAAGPAGDAEAYAFDNDAPGTPQRFRQLSEILDGATIQCLSGLGELAGARCLEVGAGGGSIAEWLAGQAGPAGRVLATDLNTRHLRTDRGYEVLRHDLVTEPVPEGPWDVVHVRMVLLHLPQRREILHRLAAALAPGGAIVVEDFETTLRKMVLAAPTAEDAALVEAYYDLLVETLLAAHGNDPTWAGRVHAAMLAEGLTDVETVVSARSWAGGTAGALLIDANITELRTDFIEAGMSAARLDRLHALARDPRLVVRGYLTYSTTGRRSDG